MLDGGLYALELGGDINGNVLNEFSKIFLGEADGG